MLIPFFSDSFTTMGFKTLLLLTCYLLQETLGERCPPDAPSVFADCPKNEETAKEGDTVILRCSTKQALEVCSWTSPQGNTVRPLPNNDLYVRSSPNNERNCDLKILRVKEVENGVWKCSPFLQGRSESETVQGMLIVAMAKSPPHLSYTHQQRDGTSKRIEDPQKLKVVAGKRLEVSCKIPNARPAADSRWFIIDGEGRRTEITRDAEHRKPMPSDGQDDTLKDRLSILKKSFNHHQNGYKIRCEMSHPAAIPGKNYAEAKLEISFKPFFIEGKEMRTFELNEQHKGEGTILFRAHPAPRPGTQIQLRVGDTMVTPGSSRLGYSVNYKSVPSTGDDTHEVTITAEDIEKEEEKTKLVFFIENYLGTDTVELRFTSEGAFGGISGGVVAGIVVGAIILLLLLIGFLIARRKHLCSSDSEAQEKEGSDTESTGDKNKTISDRFNKFCNSLVKPNKGKEDDLEKGAKEETAALDEKPVDKTEPTKERDADSIKKEDPIDEKLPPPPPEDSVVYAELDLKEGGSPPRKSSQDTTEYAEIVGTVKSE